MQALSRAADPWRWIALCLGALAPRLYLLRVYDIELSQDGFDAVNTLRILQTRGPDAVPRELIDRFILHPFYMLLLATLRIATPAWADFYFAARLLSTLIACLAIMLLFEFTRRAFDESAAWVTALLLAFAPSFLWESVAILSSTTFLALYIAVLFALLQARFRLAACLAFLSAITRYEGTALIALVFVALVVRDVRGHKIRFADWLVCGAFALAFPLTLVVGGVVATGNALEFLGAQSMAFIWLRFLAPADFTARAAFFITQYPALFPVPIIWLGVAGGIIALIGCMRPPQSITPADGRRLASVTTRFFAALGLTTFIPDPRRATALLLGTSVLYLLFFEALVWFNYTTLEVRFLMYPGLPVLVFAGVALAAARAVGSKFSRAGGWLALAAVLVVLLTLSYRQGDAGMRFIYNMHAGQRDVADELARILPQNQKTNVMIYAGVAGALDYFARQRGLLLAFSYFRFAPEDHPEQYLIDRQVQFVVYPAGNAFGKAKYPYLERLETQTHGALTFELLTHLTASTDNQLYSIWAIRKTGP